MKKSAGFTLLEIVIAIALLAFISIFVAQSIRNGLNARNKIQRDIDATVGLREALNLMSRDIQLAFNFRDINIELYNAAVKANCKGSDSTPPGEPPPPPPPPGQPPKPPPTGAAWTGEKCKPKEQKTFTQFIGDEQKLNFSTRSNIRTQRDDTTSDQAEVGYELKDCKSRSRNTSGTQSSKCLFRRFSPIIDENPREGGKSMPILENIKSLTFRYLGPGYDGEWIKSWSSDTQTAGADDRMKSKFPLAVEITMVVQDNNSKQNKEVGMTIVANVRFPNNEDPNAAKDESDAAGGGGIK